MIKESKGFTIIELLIASLVFSVMLLLITFSLLQIGRTYYKGVTMTNTQNVTRDIVDAISQDIQYSSGKFDKNTAPYIWCIGNHRYSITMNTQLTNSNSALSVSNLNGAPCVNPPLPGDPVTELLNLNMRIARFDIIPIGNRYYVSIRIVYGDDDLVCSEGAPGDCNSNTTTPFLNATDLICKNNQAGTQFCAWSELTTVVQRRTIPL